MLNARYASAHVPLLQDIDILISDVLSSLQFQRELKETAPPLKRLRTKQSDPAYYSRNSSIHYLYVDKNGNPLERCYAKSWRDYRCGHVVSKYAAKIIQQFAASHLADSLEAAENDAEPSKREREPVDSSWIARGGSVVMKRKEKQ